MQNAQALCMCAAWDAGRHRLIRASSMAQTLDVMMLSLGGITEKLERDAYYLGGMHEPHISVALEITSSLLVA